MPPSRLLRPNQAKAKKTRSRRPGEPERLSAAMTLIHHRNLSASERKSSVRSALFIVGRLTHPSKLRRSGMQLALLLLLAFLPSTLPATAPTTQSPALTAYGKLPLYFEANQGQVDSQIQF